MADPPDFIYHNNKNISEAQSNVMAKNRADALARQKARKAQERQDELRAKELEGAERKKELDMYVQSRTYGSPLFGSPVKRRPIPKEKKEIISEQQKHIIADNRREVQQNLDDIVRRQAFDDSLRADARAFKQGYLELIQETPSGRTYWPLFCVLELGVFSCHLLQQSSFANLSPNNPRGALFTISVRGLRISEGLNCEFWLHIVPEVLNQETAAMIEYGTDLVFYTAQVHIHLFFKQCTFYDF
jgi:hypothetical protein